MWRRKSRGEASLDLPMYAALVRQPTRGLPIELQQEEAGASYLTNRDAIQHELLDGARRPRDDVPLFVELMTRDHGVVTIPLDGSEQSLPVFSTPWRARDYVRTLLAKKRDVTYLSSSPLQLVSMLRDLERIGVTSLTLDRCPRCSTLAIFRTHDMVSPNDVLVVWSIHKAAEMSRADLYVGFALVSARAGRLEEARDVALEAVGHVTFEDPRLHFLLGQLGIALGDRTLVREAVTFLEFLQVDELRLELERLERTGSPDFASPGLSN